MEHVAGLGILHDCADRYRHLNGFSIAAFPIAALSVTAALCFVFGIKTKMEESIVVLAGGQDHVAAAAAIAAARAPARDVLFPSKGQATVSAVAGLDGDDYLVNEHLVGSAFQGCRPVSARRV